MQNKKLLVSKLFILSIAVLLFFVSKSNFAKTQSDTTYYSQNPVYQYQTELFKLSKLKNVDIVMFGDSHTQSGNWNELLGLCNVVNRGIAGDVTAGMLARIDQVTKLNPKVVFVLGGINDIYNWVPNENIIENIHQIIIKIKKSGGTPILQSVFYAGKYWGKDWLEANRPDLDVVKYNKERNDIVDRLNEELKLLARMENIPFLDINKKLSLKNYLRNEYTRDQLHLNANGYKVWSEILLKELKKFPTIRK